MRCYTDFEVLRILSNHFSTLEASIRFGTPLYKVRKRAVSVFPSYSVDFEWLDNFLNKVLQRQRHWQSHVSSDIDNHHFRLRSLRSRLTASDKRTPDAKRRAIMAKSRSLFLLNDERARFESCCGYSGQYKLENLLFHHLKEFLLDVFSSGSKCFFLFFVETFFITLR